MSQTGGQFRAQWQDALLRASEIQEKSEQSPRVLVIEPFKLGRTGHLPTMTHRTREFV